MVERYKKVDNSMCDARQNIEIIHRKIFEKIQQYLQSNVQQNMQNVTKCRDNSLPQSDKTHLPKPYFPV